MVNWTEDDALELARLTSEADAAAAFVRLEAKRVDAEIKALKKGVESARAARIEAFRKIAPLERRRVAVASRVDRKLITNENDSRVALHQARSKRNALAEGRRAAVYGMEMARDTPAAAEAERALVTADELLARNGNDVDALESAHALAASALGAAMGEANG